VLSSSAGGVHSASVSASFDVVLNVVASALALALALLWFFMLLLAVSTLDLRSIFA
jgi:hypothetical protein